MLKNIVNRHVTDKRLWGSAILFWIVGDIATTYYGVHIGLTESNPAARQLMSYGVGMIIFGKVGSTVVAYGHYWVTKQLFNSPYFAYAMPVILNVLGLSATLWNSYHIITF